MSFGFYSSYIALWILAIFQTLLTLAIFRQVLELERRSGTWQGVAGGESLVGARAPAFSGIDFHSGQPVNANVFDERGGVILFLSANCSICRTLSRSLQDGVLESLPPIVAICTGDSKGVGRLGRRLSQEIPLLSEGSEDAASAYKVSGYPTAVVLDGKRIIRAYHGVSTVEDIHRVVASATNGAQAMAMTPNGHSA